MTKNGGPAGSGRVGRSGAGRRTDRTDIAMTAAATGEAVLHALSQTAGVDVTELASGPRPKDEKGDKHVCHHGYGYGYGYGRTGPYQTVVALQNSRMPCPASSRP